MAFQRFGSAKRRGDKASYYIVQNYHYNGGKQLERQTSNYKEAMKFASETPKAWIGAFDDSGALIGDYHQSPGAVPLNKRQLAARAREKAGHDHRNRSGGAWPPGPNIGGGSYRITDAVASRIAGGKNRLPKHGQIIDVQIDGRTVSLFRTPVSTDAYGFKAPKRRWVYALQPHSYRGY